MPTLPGANQSISMAQINAEFGHGTNLGAYYNRRWFRDDNTRGFFQASGPISFSDFASKRATTPVVAGSATFYGSQGWNIPMFNTLYVYVRSGQGGQAGGNGNASCGGAGGAGGTSAFGGYLAQPGGAGGASCSNAYGGYTEGAFQWVVTDANFFSFNGRYGEPVYITVGGGGSGGGGGTSIVCGYGFCLSATAPAGGAGAAGYVYVSWS